MAMPARKNMINHLAYKKQPSVKHIAKEFLAENFEYDKLTDTYTCPAGAVLTSPGQSAVQVVLQVWEVGIQQP